MEDLEKILKQLYLVSGLNMSIFDINQKLLAAYPHEKSKFCHEIEKSKASDHCFICDINAMNHVKRLANFMSINVILDSVKQLCLYILMVL